MAKPNQSIQTSIFMALLCVLSLTCWAFTMIFEHGFVLVLHFIISFLMIYWLAGYITNILEYMKDK